uniref:VASt domain-containing protein n=1 Tax=Salarias fasciatus TaxID=181472 RepID=A0A672GA53_SALFA
MCLAAPQAPQPYYKLRLDEFRKLFKEVPSSERLIVDYTCALQRDILLQGRLYLSENWVCFYSNVFRGTKIMLILGDVRAMTREKTARLIPNAIQISTEAEKFFFTSFSAREKSYQGIFRMWQNTLMQKPLTSSEFWLMVRQHYGNDLGLSHEEMESLQMSSESNMQTSLTAKLGGEDNQGRMERPPSLRITAAEYAPVETSTPQREESPSPIDVLGPVCLDYLRFLISSSPSSVEERGDVSHQASGRLYLNKVFHIGANKMFELLFTDSSFIRRFMNVRKMTNSSFTAWQKDASGNMKRSLNYTITITNPLIGKFSAATENQTLYKESRDGQYYLVDSEVYTHDVPYHDYFYTQNRYCIMSNSKRKCRLRVYTDVKYKKQPWGLVKSFITKNSWSGIEEYFKQLEAELLEEEAEINQGGGDAGKMGGLRRRRRAYSRTMPEHIKPNKQFGQDSEPHRDVSTGTEGFNGNSEDIVFLFEFEFQYEHGPVETLQKYVMIKVTPTLHLCLSLFMQCMNSLTGSHCLTRPESYNVQMSGCCCAMLHAEGNVACLLQLNLKTVLLHFRPSGTEGPIQVEHHYHRGCHDCDVSSV